MNNKLIFEELPRLMMNRNAINTYPLECCGFLVGHTAGQQATVKMAIAVKNAAASNQHCYFLIPAQNYVAAERFAEKNNLSLLGVYHSHPNQSPLPSGTDMRFALPNFFYVILSVRDKKVTETKCWQLGKEEYFEEQSLDI
ncbi:M67 family metallopeptidase [Pedobacter sp. AW31-3R]|uniref:M67 family metallopeptidase n=1 Tax=Pedobacter sp. AW31-3R TaxID=3445781 RepID=UPI003F9FEF9E